MPVYIERTKSMANQKGEVVSTRVHYAVAVAPAGNVTEWTEDHRKAKAFDDGDALKVMAFYEAKAADKVPVGRIEMKNSVAPAAPAPSREKK
jgi:hypothetical protein